jgi:hypothetical protein
MRAFTFGQFQLVSINLEGRQDGFFGRSRLGHGVPPGASWQVPARCWQRRVGALGFIPVSLRTNARAICSMRLRIGDRDCARRPWQVL